MHTDTWSSPMLRLMLLRTFVTVEVTHIQWCRLVTASNCLITAVQHRLHVSCWCSYRSLVRNWCRERSCATCTLMLLLSLLLKHSNVPKRCRIDAQCSYTHSVYRGYYCKHTTLLLLLLHVQYKIASTTSAMYVCTTTDYCAKQL
jgi:hypothetical protein